VWPDRSLKEYFDWVSKSLGMTWQDDLHAGIVDFCSNRYFVTKVMYYDRQQLHEVGWRLANTSCFQ